jgi:hypothetical protein
MIIGYLYEYGIVEVLDRRAVSFLEYGAVAIFLLVIHGL